ncbi:Gfo/Idh/MocA family protein [Adhaeretor mobilis]|uniref:4-carboxy-2-hydroxymuconate-6-semialdehyde dehydrogenase n=1 Tax=Adhaeretor mobilis TaxID=1930276 RepID=A0A517MTY4_9BACT|nr:Gfo/Idh/MocA family oxidoreductase [Adhaeretor mobilis]QDS98350.1 4-carboxy-2-hydroxymuconate-6-semialdehyde dehydrogenase [Adhaeretor mobilis]
MNNESVTRRNFISGTVAGVTSLAMNTKALAATTGAQGNANERLRIGFIGVGGRCNAHLDSAIAIFKKSGTVELASVCDVFNRRIEEAATRVEQGTGKRPTTTSDYREILADDSIDAVVIATPDHWHARQTIDAFNAGKHVYCEKPMTHSVEEALEVHKQWKQSGKVMQVGVQSTSLPVWDHLNLAIREGKIGKVMQYQTEYFRNSDMGQWRYYPLAEDMTPKNVDWKMFLGTEFGLAPDMAFDRAKFAQWRCYWAFGSGMFTDLFVHRTTTMLKGTGLRFPGRVVGAGGLFLEYDGRQVPDVATVVADFDEGVQGLVTATMCSNNTPIKQVIRGHHGAMVLGSGDAFTGYDFVAERPQVTHDSSIVDERIELGRIGNQSLAHFQNFVDAVAKGDPEAVNCTPELGAAAMTVVKLGTRSYREGKVFHFDKESMQISDGSPAWAKKWEQVSANRGTPNHVPGWTAGDTGSVMHPQSYQRLEGEWNDGVDPAKVS